MSPTESGLKPGQVAIENVNHPGQLTMVEAGKYHAMRNALLEVLPLTAPGLTFDQMLEAAVPVLPERHFPGGAKAGWWCKAVQLDLEAKGLVARKSPAPLRWHRVSR
jgi:hypothetical protein